MKAPTLQSFLEECRAAKTSNEIGLVVDQIENKIGAMRAERSKFDGQLQEAIVAGRDPGKIHTAVAQLDQDLMTLEAALSGFSRRQKEVRKQEETSDTQTRVSQHRVLSSELAEATKRAAATTEQGRQEWAAVADLAMRLDRSGSAIEAAGLRPDGRASAIIRNTVGEVRRGDGVSEYGRRIDITLAEVLEMNPGQLMRARDTRRQRGRFGESSAFNDAAVESLMTRARDIDRKAVG